MPRKLAPLPPPSATLRGGALPLLVTNQPFVRIHRLKRDPAFWGRTRDYRFDAPTGEYGVLYAAEAFDGGFIETFGDVAPKVVSVIALAARGVAAVTPRRALRLVDFAGAGLSRLGLDARIGTDDYERSQEWSRALWSHPSQPDGIWYAARHDPGQRAVALFDRASAVVGIRALSGLMDRPQDAVTARAIEKYGFALVPGGSP